MSLVANGPHTVTIWQEIVAADTYGNVIRKPTSVPTIVTGCIVLPIASTRGAFPAIDTRQGQRVDAAWRLMARDAPLGWWSRVEFEGKTMTVLGGPLVYGASPATRHVSATLIEER